MPEATWVADIWVRAKSAVPRVGLDTIWVIGKDSLAIAEVFGYADVAVAGAVVVELAGLKEFSDKFSIFFTTCFRAAKASRAVVKEKIVWVALDISDRPEIWVKLIDVTAHLRNR